MHDSPCIDPLRSVLFTDLYELTMAQAYDAERMEQPAVFELIFRTSPGDRNYVVAAGLDDVLAYLEALHFSDDDVTWLSRQGLFSDRFLKRLKALRFTGDVYAVAEGTPVFPNEPLVQVAAPLLEAQIVETLILNQVHFQTVLATKASRVVEAAAGRDVIEFGARRAHGVDAALKAARTSYLAGAAGTSLVLAGKIYSIPLFGTMAHSYIEAHNDELQAFEAFADVYPETTLLVDTYDTLNGVQKVVDLSRKLQERFRIRAVRLDSGDLPALARKARKMLDEAGLAGVRIFATGGLDEYEIAKLIAADAPIDGFGVGTKLVVSEDAPAIDMAYKLVEYAGRPRMKLSEKKSTLPGRKQVYRQVRNGQIVGDLIGRYDEEHSGEPLLAPVMHGGQRLAAGRVTLEDARRHARRERERLPETLRPLRRVENPYPVRVSDALRQNLESLRSELEAAK